MVNTHRCSCNSKSKKNKSKGKHKKSHHNQEKVRTFFDVLNEKKEYGTPYVDWKISEEQLTEVSKKYKVVPLYISFKTKQLSNIRHIQNKLLKEIHYRFKSGHFAYTIPYRKLSSEDLELLKVYDIKSHVVKHRIFLNT